MRSLLAICLLMNTVDITTGIFGRTQSAAAKGRMICNGMPASGVKVKLYDDDSGPDLDDLMDETTTDNQGFFSVSGHTDELTTIDPKINVYHDCNDGLKPCQRKFSIKIPKSYVNSGSIPSRTFDAGLINLEGHPGDESRDCLNFA